MGYSVRFWGVRGSIACASPDHVVYGGNTSCVEIDVAGQVLILDAGTGIRFLGQSLMKRKVSQATLLMTHTHWDHINGFPFFVPAYVPTFSLKIMAGHLGERMGGIKGVLTSQMQNPTFPVPIETMRGALSFEDFEAGATFSPYPEVVVKTAPLKHPNEATGYRIEHAGFAVCYITDTEHVPGQPDPNVLGLIKGADLVIYDCTYTDDEFPAKIGWGHSTWQEGVRMCDLAGAKRLVVFHHDPDHIDPVMAEIEAAVQAARPGSIVARDGMEIVLA